MNKTLRRDKSILKLRWEQFQKYKNREVDNWKSFRKAKEIYQENEKFEEEYIKFKNSIFHCMDRIFESGRKAFYFKPEPQYRVYAEKLVRDKDFADFYRSQIVSGEVLVIRVKELV